MAEVTTDTIILVTLKVNHAEARERISTWAKAFGVTIDAIEENPKRLEVELAVTVTGERDDVDGLRDELTTTNQASDSSFFTGPLSVVIDPVSDLLGDVAKARFKRWRRGREV